MRIALLQDIDAALANQERLYLSKCLGGHGYN
ncbi:uncharacterized protein FIBRA_09452 [Fibroporia radiculosa]|uniref:Uncharacterized protein n=1 Tax=Fibroporia radiculosa TaxID=599839 RepID=J7SD17_9APHY|nr:uncharacterized protein FIBRA_09452 [Fibroporia radiculosa]CCM07118.1 predicted protein [Fibroporia radiculosa]